jgi:hypothetical protein
MWGKNTNIWRAIYFTTLILSSIGISFASCNSTNNELKIKLIPKYGYGNVILSYSLNKTIESATLNVFVEKYQIEANSFYNYGYEIKKTIQKEINSSSGEFQISISELEPWLYRFFVNLSLNNDVYCAYSDYMLLQRTLTTEKIVYVEKEPNLTINLISAPKEVSPNQIFEVIVNLTNLGADTNIKIYSYVYKYSNNSTQLISMGKNNLNFSYNWNANEREIFLPSLSSSIVFLENKIIENASEGEYNLRIRAKINESKYDLTTKIFVKKEVSITRFDFSNNTLYISITNHGNIEKNVSLILIDNEILRRDFLINGKTTKEFSFLINNTNAFVLLLVANNLIDIKQLNSSIELQNTSENQALFEEKLNSSDLNNYKEKSEVNKSIEKITGFSFLSEEISLYLVIFSISLLMFVVLFRRFK